MIDVRVSEGPSSWLPTHLVGESCTAAAAQLTALHVKCDLPGGRPHLLERDESNRIARVLYKGTVNPIGVPRGATVMLERSKGPGGIDHDHDRTATTTTTAATGHDHHDHHNNHDTAQRRTARRAQRGGR